MSALEQYTFDEITAKGLVLASNAFEADFLVVNAPHSRSLRQDFQQDHGPAVTFAILEQEESTLVEFLIRGPELTFRILRGTLAAEPNVWIKRLAKSVQELLLKELELQQQNDLTTDYASQISRDFEELVWTRELAQHIQQTDIRNSLAEFVDYIFPTLMETVQAAQLVLVQYPHGELDPGQLPALEELELSSLGASVASSENLYQILTRYAERGRHQPIVCNQCSTLRIPGCHCLILVPIHAKQKEFGWIIAVNREATSDDLIPGCSSCSDFLPSPEFGSFEAGLMQSAASFLASHANNTSLYSEKEDLLIGIVRALINAIDAKDHYTCGHSDRVAAVARKLAQQLGLEEHACEEIYLAGLLHDVGKIGVPDRVLLKKDALTEAELALLKQHPVIGYHVLQHLKQISYILPGVLHHHESLDGSGYPNGLVGKEIPLEARIIAVADAFDAMTSDRPYRCGMPSKRAEEILRSNVGPQWDPQVLDAFFECRDEVHAICFRSEIAEENLDQDFHGKILQVVGNLQ